MGRWDKLVSKLPRYAGLAGAAALGTAALMTPEEAQGAGITTIMEKLGVGLEDAQQIKKLAASNIPQDVFEQNIRALKEVKGYKQDPSVYSKIGYGADYKAFETPEGKVLKVPNYGTENNDIFQIAPSLTEQAGLGPKTKTIQLGNKSYMLQDKVTPLDSIKYNFKNEPRLKEINEQSKILQNEYDDLPFGDPREKKIKDQFDILNNEYEKIRSKHKKQILSSAGINVDDLVSKYKLDSKDARKKAFYESLGITSPEDVVSDPKTAFEAALKFEAVNKLGDHLRPVDLHGGNIGLDINKNPTIFDTSRFEGFSPENLTPEMKQKILESNVGLPERRGVLKRILNPISDEQHQETMKLLNNSKLNFDKNAEGNAPMMEFPNAEKIAAGVGGAAMLGGATLGSNDASAESLSPLPKINEGYEAFNKYIREPIANKAHQLSDKIVEGTTPLQGEEKQNFLQQTQPIFGGMAEMAADPVNYIPGGPEADLMMQFPKLNKYLRGQ